MIDIQNSPSPVAMAIDRVGVKDLVVPLTVREMGGGRQSTVASMKLSVDLPACFKGTHMSRFSEAVESWDKHLTYESLRAFLSDLKERLAAERAFVSLRFAYFMRKASPVSGRSALQSYECEITGERNGMTYDLSLTVITPVMTVCPCSKAISDEGAHSQRALVTIKARHKGLVWIEELVDMAERSASSPVYPLLKREDEKYVTEISFANPLFVEDVARRAADKLQRHKHIDVFRVDVESLESIHAHNAFARIENAGRNTD